MGTWITFWQYVMWTAFVIYFAQAILVFVGGAFDLRRMFQRLNALHRDDPMIQRQHMNAPRAEEPDSPPEQAP